MDLREILRFIDFDRLPLALLVLVVGVVGVRILTRFLDQLAERFSTRRLLFKKTAALGRFFVYLALFLGTASSVLVLESEALFAIAGSIGVAVGFAFKDLLASLMAGVILLFDQPFQVGDRVTFKEWYGEITSIGLRSVRLVTLDDNLVTIPNGAFLSEAVASANAGSLHCMVVIPVYVAAGEDFEGARRIVREAALTSPYVFLDKPVVTLIDDRFLGERFLTVLTLKAYVFDARHEKTFESDVWRRVKAAFAEAGIKSPDQQYRDLDINEGRERAPDAPAG
jgi:small-conductance mechanosensitive channel